MSGGPPSFSTNVRRGSSSFTNNNKPVSFQRSINQNENQNAPSIGQVDLRAKPSQVDSIKEEAGPQAKPISRGDIAHVDKN